MDGGRWLNRFFALSWLQQQQQLLLKEGDGTHPFLLHNHTFFAGKGAFSTLPFPFRRTYENRELQQRRKRATKTDFGTNDGGSETDRTDRRKRIEEEEEQEILFVSWMVVAQYFFGFLFIRYSRSFLGSYARTFFSYSGHLCYRAA